MKKISVSLLGVLFFAASFFLFSAQNVRAQTPEFNPPTIRFMDTVAKEVAGMSWPEAFWINLIAERDGLSVQGSLVLENGDLVREELVWLPSGSITEENYQEYTDQVIAAIRIFFKEGEETNNRGALAAPDNFIDLTPEEDNAVHVIFDIMKQLYLGEYGAKLEAISPAFLTLNTRWGMFGGERVILVSVVMADELVVSRMTYKVAAKISFKNLPGNFEEMSPGEVNEAVRACAGEARKALEDAVEFLRNLPQNGQENNDELRL